MERIYRGAHDPEWLFPAPEDAELASSVVRKAEYKRPPEQSERRYVEKSEIKGPVQPDLFA